ncbi:hypothetical protein IJU97_01630 [bacterium]|nr:hypothetical protein [bacterium]
MRKEKQKIWDKVFPYVIGLAILLGCLAFKGFGSVGASSNLIISDSLEIESILLVESSSLHEVTFRATGKEFLHFLEYFQECNPGAELINVRREVAGNPTVISGYTVTFKK